MNCTSARSTTRRPARRPVQNSPTPSRSWIISTNLGINAVGVAAGGGGISRRLELGYTGGNPCAVENTGYGGPDGLKNFVKAAHQRGIRVLLDVVHNHYGPSDLDHSFDTGSGPSIYFYTAPDIKDAVGSMRPTTPPTACAHISDNFKMWLDEFHVDGFRWDSGGTMRQYAPNHYSIPEADTLIQSINSTVIHANHPALQHRRGSIVRTELRRRMGSRLRRHFDQHGRHWK